MIVFFFTFLADVDYEICKIVLSWSMGQVVVATGHHVNVKMQTRA